METNDAGVSLTPSYRQLSNEFRFESKRLQTFECWPIDAPIESARVAKAGFYFTGRGCEVQCFACGGKISQWNYGDQAVSKHRQMNPSCPFLLNRSSNVSIQSENDNNTPQSSQSSQEIPRRNTTTDSSVQRNPMMNTQNPLAPSPSTIVPMASHESRQPLPSSLPGHGTLSSQSPTLSHHEWLALRSEEARLQTFNSCFTPSHPSPSELAEAGFFYLGVSDHVQCAFCRGVIKDWKQDDIPLHEHTRHFSRCPFVLGLPVGNIPIGSSPQSTGLGASVRRSANEGFDVSPRFTPESRPSARPDTEGDIATVSVGNLDKNRLEDLGITQHSGPRHPNYATYESRVKTYKKWPPHCRQTPSSMAQAGFFYLGVADHVSCFHCGAGLRNWEPEDDPWVEHARWFPECRFVCLVKSEQFIKEAMQNHVSKPQRPQPPFRNPEIPRPRDVSEAEILMMLDSPIVQTVLAMGIDLSRVKMALKERMRATGQPFPSEDSLLQATITLQHYNEDLLALEDSNYETVEWSEIRPERHAASSETTESESDAEAAAFSSNNRTNNETTTRPESVVESSQTSPEAKAETQIQSEDKQACQTETNKPEGADRTQLLEEEIRRLKEARLCKVCLDEEVSIAYIPCGHIVTCTQCAAALEQCPLCRKNIKGTVKIFFS